MTEELSPALTEIDGQFAFYGQQIQHTQTQLLGMQEERLRIQGRYAQREADEAELADLQAALDHLRQQLIEQTAITARLQAELEQLKPLATAGQEHVDALTALVESDPSTVAPDGQNPPPEPAGDTSPTEPPQPAADAATGA